MIPPQAISLAILAGLLVLFIWDRLRFDIVALLALLIAVAVGASCDFLSPIGHQCNTLVIGPGGYRFGDYWHLGLPLSILIVILGTPLILAVWPLH